MKRIYALIVAIVVFGFLIIPNAQAQPLIPKINLSGAPVPPVSGCVGEDLGFSGSTVQNFPLALVTYPNPRWTVTGPGTLTNANTNNVTYNCAAPGTFVLTYSAIKLGVTYTVSVNVTTVDKDILTLDLPASFPYSICEGSSVTLKASGPTDYFWEREKGAVIDPLGSTAQIIDTPPTFGVWTYRVYGSSAGCATIPDNIQFVITVDQAPTVNDGGPYTTCYGSPIALNGSIGGSALSAQWIGGLGTFNPNRNALNATYTPALSESGTSVSLTLRTDDPAGICSFAETTTTLTVNPLPSTITGITSVCMGLTTTLASATPGGSWSSATPAVAIIDAGGVVTAVSAGTSVISYTLPTGCFVTTTVTVNPLPAAITGTTDVCVGSTTLLSNASLGGAWSSGTPAVATISVGGLVTGVTAGTSIITYTLPTGCKITTTVTVNPLPGAITGTTVVCAGSTTTLSNTTPGGSWSSGTPAVATIDAVGVVTGVSAGSSVITYTLPTGCKVTTTVNVNPLPAAITGTTSVCVSLTTTLSNATPGGTWSSATPAVATITAGGVVTGVSAGTSIISYTLPTGCAVTTTVTVNIMPTAITGVTSVCLGSSSTLSNSTPGGTWSSGTPAVATISVGGVVTSVSAGTTVISYSLGSGCTVTTLFTVNPLPAAITGTTTVCRSSTTLLSNATPGGTWSSATPAVATISVAGLVTGVAAGTSVISYTLPTGCAVTTTVTVNALPAAIAGLATICIGSSTTLTNATPGGTWSSITPAVATIDAGGVVTGIAAGSSSIRYTLPTGCFRSRTETVVALPTITLGAVNAVCQDATSFSLPYTATSGTPTTYSISAGVPALAGFTPIVDAAFTASPLIINIPGGSVAGAYQFTITVKNATGCVSIGNNFNLTINPIPAAITGTTTVCVGSTAPLANATLGGVWSSATPAVATISAGGVVTGVSAGTSVISYTLGTGCKATTTVTVNPLPAAITGSSSVCIGSTTALANTTPGGTWSSATPAVATIDAGGVVTGVTTGTSVITYTLPTSCSISTSVTVNPLPTITLGLINAVCKVASSFSLPYSATTGTPTTYSITAGIPALTGFVPMVNAAFGASPLTVPIPANSSPNTYQFILTVKNGNGCVSTSQNFNITINDLPVVTFGGILATQCLSSTIYVLSGGTPVGGVYSGPGVTGTNFNASVAGVGTHTITYTYSDVNGCNGSATNTITVNPLISNNTITTTKLSICYNSIPVQFTGTNPAGGNGAYTFQWQSSTIGAAGPFTDILGETGIDYLPSIAITQDTWYRRNVTSLPCSDLSSNVIKITVGPVFTVSTTLTNPKCVGSNDGTATAVPVGGTPIMPGSTYNYSWNTVPVQNTKTATGLIAGTYTVTVTDNIGCTAIGTAIVTDPTPLTLGVPTITNVTGCFGGTNGSIQILAAGGTSPYKYDLYNNGAFVATQTVAGAVTFTQPTTPITASTLYEIRVTDANGCGPVLSGNITVNQPIAVDFTYSKLDVSCNGTLTGEIHFTASGGTPPYEYSLDDGFTWGNNPDLLTLAAGNYDLKVRDFNLCESTTKPEEIIEPEQIITNGGTWKNITSCFNDNTGEIDVKILSGGVPPYQYSIDAGATWQASGLFQNLFAGNYTIIVKDASGCTVNVGPIPITQPTQVTFTETVTNVTTCWNNLNGSIRVNSAAGGPSPRTTSIDNITYYTIPHLFGSLGIGNYTVYVKNANGCTATKSIAITGPTPITLTGAPTIVPVSCNGSSDGEIHVIATGGAGGLTYSLDGGPYQVTGDFTLLTGGDHTLNVKDINGCIFTQTITVTEPPVITFTAPSSTDISCFGLIDGKISAGATGGIGALTYKLLPGGVVINADGNFTGLSAGTYSVRATDANGCFVETSNFTILEPAVFTFVSATSTPLNCNGDNSTITLVTSGGTAPISYNVKDGGAYDQTTNDGIFPNVPAGTYSYTITDANTCNTFSSPPSIIITQPTPMVVSVPVITQMTAPGANDGKIKLSATGGTPNYTFTLNPGGAVLPGGSGVDVEFTLLSAGTYSVDVKDANGCMQTVNNIKIGLLDITITPTQITCNGSNNGKIDLIINSGTGPFTIVWTGPSDMSAFNDMLSLTNLAPGLYTANVTDALGVTGVVTTTLVEPAVISATFVVLDKQCFGDPNGTVTFNIVGGTAPYTISWNSNSGSTTNPIVTLPPGKYNFSITDVNNCPAFTIPDTTLLDPAKLNISDIKWVNPCFGVTDGSITVTATGGTGALDYVLTGPPNDNNSFGNFGFLPAGTYTISLTDANGCIASSDVPLTKALTENPQINITAIPSPYLTCPYDLGSIDVTVLGGTPSYTFSWNTIPAVNTEDLSNAQIDDYTVTVTDAAGCSNFALASITGPDMLIVNANIDDALCSGLKQNGVADFGRIEILSTTGGTGSNFTYLWDFPLTSPTTGKIIDNLSSGTYTVTITDENNCQYKEPFIVGFDPDYFLNAIIKKDTMLCGSARLDLVALPNGPVERTYDYSWYKVPDIVGPILSKDSIFTINPTESGQYFLEIRNDGGCFSSDYVNITIYPKIGLKVPLYIQGLQQDTIISLLYGSTLNLDVITASTEYPTTFSWEPKELFSPPNSWNSSIFIDEEKYAQLPANRIVKLKENPAINRLTDFIKIDVNAVTSRGCKDSLTVYAKMLSSVSIGNVFSPNGDGINDIWLVPKEYFFPDLSVEIFDRWGALVWSAKGDKAVKGWDGRTNNGKDLPIGTYYYIVKYNIDTSNGDWKPASGSITIVR